MNVFENKFEGVLIVIESSYKIITIFFQLNGVRNLTPQLFH